MVQPSSVPVDRRARRAIRWDRRRIALRTLLAWFRGEPRVCSMVPIPNEADEDERRRVREREDLVAERIAIDSYPEMIQYFGNDDPTTRRLMEGILAMEEEHADDLVSLLEELGS